MKHGLVLFGSLAAVSLIACKADSPAPTGPCFGCGPDIPPEPPTSMLLVENATDHDVTVIMSEPSMPTVIDRRIIEGSLEVPIAPELNAPKTPMPIVPGDIISIDRQINVLEKQTSTVDGAVLRLGDGPSILAVGNGKLVVRSRDGRDVLEAEDPRAVTVVPADHELPVCEPSAYGELLPLLPAEMANGDSMNVLSVTRDGDGCRLFNLKAFDGYISYRACVPDAAYPFADTDTLVASPFDTGMQIANDSGATLDLLPVLFDTRSTVYATGIAFAYSDQPTCATIESTCASVELPAKLRLSFDGKTPQTLSLGDAIADPANAKRTLYFLGARSRPVFAATCPARGTSFSPTEMFVAIVGRP